MNVRSLKCCVSRRMPNARSLKRRVLYGLLKYFWTQNHYNLACHRDLWIRGCQSVAFCQESHMQALWSGTICNDCGMQYHWNIEFYDDVSMRDHWSLMFHDDPFMQDELPILFYENSWMQDLCAVLSTMIYERKGTSVYSGFLNAWFLKPCVHQCIKQATSLKSCVLRSECGITEVSRLMKFPSARWLRCYILRGFLNVRSLEHRLR